MPFFRPLEDSEPPAPAPRPTPVWTPPHSGALGGFVPLRIELARTDEVVVLLGPMDAHPNGVQLTLRTRSRHPGIGPMHFMPDEGVEPLRLGVELADGRTTESGRPWWQEGDPGEGPILQFAGGGGGGGEFRQDLWLWPLPPPGPLTFHVVWQDVGIDERSVTIDAGVIIEAARDAETLWEPLTPEEERDAARRQHRRFASRGGTSFTMTHAASDTEPEAEPDEPS